MRAYDEAMQDIATTLSRLRTQNADLKKERRKIQHENKKLKDKVEALELTLVQAQLALGNTDIDTHERCRIANLKIAVGREAANRE